jgi:hypothetical protein
MAPTTEETNAAVEAAKKQLADAEAAHAAATAESAEPRAPGVVVTDLLERIVDRMGNRPELEKLVKELKATAPKPEPAPEEQPPKAA